MSLEWPTLQSEQNDIAAGKFSICVYGTCLCGMLSWILGVVERHFIALCPTNLPELRMKVSHPAFRSGFLAGEMAAWLSSWLNWESLFMDHLTGIYQESYAFLFQLPTFSCSSLPFSTPSLPHLCQLQDFQCSQPLYYHLGAWWAPKRAARNPQGVLRAA